MKSVIVTMRKYLGSIIFRALLLSSADASNDMLAGNVPRCPEHRSLNGCELESGHGGAHRACGLQWPLPKHPGRTRSAQCGGVPKECAGCYRD